MRSKKNVETTKLKEGEYLEKQFDNYIDMATSAVDWTLFCSYQLQPIFSEGIHKVLQLPSMQLAYTNMLGGIMFDYVAPEECITFSVMKKISQKACINQMKLETGMIAVVNDKKVYNFICSSQVEIFDISLNKNANPTLIKQLTQAVDRYYVDSEKRITSLLESFFATYTEAEEPLDAETSRQIEKQITEALFTLLDTQEAQTPRFTKSEKIVLKIKNDVFKHMDRTMSVEDLAKKYTISMKSLQNAFKSLYGLKPNTFMRLLKLNLVHHDLMRNDSTQSSVLEIARKWGFKHMGRFSKYYKELFGENPSVTLKSPKPQINGMNAHCVERKEEVL
jgi:AraC-like DNA-binding protein